MNLKSFLTCLAFLSLSSCSSLEIRNYKFAFKHHPKIGGGVMFGVLDHKFMDMTTEQIDDLLKTSVIMPASTWNMLAVDLIKACKLLGKKCKQEVQVLNSAFIGIEKQNNIIERMLP